MKKSIVPVLIIFSLFVLVSCAGQPQAVSVDQGNSQESQSSGSTGSQSGLSNNINSKLAIGILKLEGSSMAITSDQAKQLLPLWQQVQTLMANFNRNNITSTPISSTNSNNSSGLSLIYQQIQSILTGDQLQAIQLMTFSQSDIESLMAQYNIQFTPGSIPTGGTFPTPNPNQQSTRQAARETQVAASGGTPEPFGTPGAGGFGSRGSVGTYDRIFIGPLITMLQQRAGS